MKGATAAQLSQVGAPFGEHGTEGMQLYTTKKLLYYLIIDRRKLEIQICSI